MPAMFSHDIIRLVFFTEYYKISYTIIGDLYALAQIDFIIIELS